MTTHPPDRLVLERFVLRRQTEGDAARIAAAVSANRDHLVPWMPWASAPEAVSLEAQRARLEAAQTAWERGTDYQFLALPEDESDLLGIFGLHRRIGPGGIELGYWVARDAVGRGYATEAARALTQAALALDDVVRVEIHCDEANVRSQAVARRAGYRLDRVEHDGVEAPAEVGRSTVWVFPADAEPTRS